MRILHVYKDYYPILGGIENHIRYLAEAQAAAGHDVTVLVTSLDRHTHIEMLNGVRVIYASRLFAFSSAPVSLNFFRQITRLDPDIAHLQSPYPFGEIAQTWLGHASATILSYQSDIVRQRITGALYTPVLHRVLAHVDTIVASSPNYVDSSPILQHWRAKCTVVPLGIPIPAAESLAPVRTTPNGNRLLFAGKLRYYKGLNYLLEALPQLPDATLTVVGDGLMEQRWKRLAETLGVSPRVQWLGQVSDAELTRQYAACDIFVLPCSERSEAYGTVQLEAMLAGKPVVSCDVHTGVAWVNQNGVTGLVTPPKNPSALASAIGCLMQDAELRIRMGQAGRARVLQEFTIPHMAEQMMQVYDRALAAKSRLTPPTAA